MSGGISRRNHEGYWDPTAYEAMCAVARAEKKAAFRPLVYICSPFAGDTTANIAAARRYCRYAVEQGYLPIAPHLFFPQFMDDSNAEERERAMSMNMILLGKCHELWRFGDYISKGMSAEIEYAKRKDKPIRSFSGDCEEIHESI